MPIYKQKKKKDGISQYKVVINYTDRNGKYHQKTKLVYGKDTAAYTERIMQQEIKNEIPDDAMTVNELFEEYKSAKKHEVRESTLDKSSRILNMHVLPILGNTRLNDLNVKVLQKWKNAIGELDLKITSKNNIYTELRTLLNFAVKMEYLKSNPLVKLGSFKDASDFSKPQDVLHYYTAEQFKSFIEVAKNHCNSLTDWGYYVFFNIAFYTGMRKGEINALKWSDIEDNIIHIRRSVNQKAKGKTLVETPPKNKTSYRDIQAPKQLLDILSEHKQRQMQDKSFSDDFRICGGIKCLADTSISNYNNKYADLANLPHIRVHDFRHTHATLLINEGINIQEIARRLGHSKVEITWNTYAHLYPREEERAIKILEALKI